MAFGMGFELAIILPYLLCEWKVVLFLSLFAWIHLRNPSRLAQCNCSGNVAEQQVLRTSTITEGGEM